MLLDGVDINIQLSICAMIEKWVSIGWFNGVKSEELKT